MRARFETAVFLFSSTILSGCGGSGGSAQGDTDDIPEIFFGSTDPAMSRSGLAYADGTQSRGTVGGTVRVIRVVTDTQTGIATETITDETLNIFSGQEDNFSLTLDGETLVFVGNDATRADMTEITGLIPSTFDNLNHVAIMRLFANEASDGRDDEITIAHFVSGFETTPGSTALTTGSATYTGPVQGTTDTGVLSGRIEGTFTLNAEFGGGAVSGDVVLSRIDTALGSATASFDIGTRNIIGNGFAGALTLTDCSFASCETESEIGGVFYGPNAEEVAGVISLDLTVTDAMAQTDQVNGNAGFGGTPVP